MENKKPGARNEEAPGSATAETHYTVRPLNLLRVHHEKIEAWILEQTGIVFDAKTESGKLRVAGDPLQRVTLQDTIEHD